MYEYDEVITLPSGTEISIEAAIGDLGKIRADLLSEAVEEYVDWSGEISDLGHVMELLRLLGA
jgi:hypothetical protein